ncbi:rootletin-like [Gracilinanus agilis]|uniref:rootletin-like n=1 Tax=Gracilinanus agilis TaxID=191870 RepID=UPI001CFEF476|nr:rootletin-like [Gracilinanus agilis]
MEQGQSLLEMGGPTQLELQQELERLRGAQAQSERTMEARERVHRQRIRGLEDHISTLKERLQQEVRRGPQSFSPSSPSSVAPGN